MDVPDSSDEEEDNEIEDDENEANSTDDEQVSFWFFSDFFWFSKKNFELSMKTFQNCPSNPSKCIPIFVWKIDLQIVSEHCPQKSTKDCL